MLTYSSCLQFHLQVVGRLHCSESKEGPSFKAETAATYLLQKNQKIAILALTPTLN